MLKNKAVRQGEKKGPCVTQEIASCIRLTTGCIMHSSPLLHHLALLHHLHCSKIRQLRAKCQCRASSREPRRARRRHCARPWSPFLVLPSPGVMMRRHYAGLMRRHGGAIPCCPTQNCCAALQSRRVGGGHRTVHSTPFRPL